jgi:hypothetical protein
MDVCDDAGEKAPACRGALRRLRAIAPIPGAANGAPAVSL